jgi:hypothetical protein
MVPSSLTTVPDPSPVPVVMTTRESRTAEYAIEPSAGCAACFLAWSSSAFVIEELTSFCVSGAGPFGRTAHQIPRAATTTMTAATSATRRTCVCVHVRIRASRSRTGTLSASGKRSRENSSSSVSCW